MLLKKVYAYAKQNADKYAEAFRSKNSETLSAMQQEYRKIAAPMIATNKNVGSIFTGPQQQIPDSFGKAVVGPFTKYQKIFEEVAIIVGEQRFKRVSQPSMIKQMIKKPKATMPELGLYNETFAYCMDLWIIVSRYINTAS